MADHRTHHPAEAHAARSVAAEVHDTPHASDRAYVWIAIILAVITAIETATYYIPNFPFLIPFLLVMSAAKFALVAGYFMHLKFDSKLFTAFFCFGLFVAVGTIVALIALFKGLW